VSVDAVIGAIALPSGDRSYRFSGADYRYRPEFEFDEYQLNVGHAQLVKLWIPEVRIWACVGSGSGAEI
jgi:hypothetical protein